METTEAQKKIKDQYERTLQKNKELALQVACAANKVGESPSLFLDGFLKYDTNVGTFGNKVYEDIAVKAGMYFKYHVEESYHFERQAILSEMIRSCKEIRSIVDIGFAVPGKYVMETLKERPSVHITLLDKFPSSIALSEALLSCLGHPWKDQITLGMYDMDSTTMPGEFDAYVFFDSIEHTKDPSGFLDKLLASTPQGAYFIFSLPIERIEVSGGGEGDDMHFIEFLSEDEIREWLTSHGLTILEERVTKPKQGDVWLPVEDTFYNLILKTKKA